MQITNKLNLPDAVVKAVTNRPYSKGAADFSATQLLGPPQIGQLMAEHGDSLTEDASDRFWALLGSAMHVVLGWAAGNTNPEVASEVRLFGSIDVDGITTTISGSPDNVEIDRGLLSDYKITSVWTAISGARPEWQQQANIYRWLLAQNGTDVDRLQIIMLFRDWSKTKATREPGYPQAMIMPHPVIVWPLEVTEEFIRERIRLHRQSPPPECTEEDRWFRGGQIAVMKKGNKRAVRLLDTVEEAEQYMDSKHLKRPEHYIDERPGENVRCEPYCPVASVCQQWARIRGADGNPL